MLALLVWAFSVYGFLAACWHILNLVVWRRKAIPPVTAILVVHNGAEYIEGLLRTLLGVTPLAKREVDVVVVDCWSDDGTAEIVQRLCWRKQGVSVRRVEHHDDLYATYNQCLSEKGRGIFCTFDLRHAVAPWEVLPILAALWGTGSGTWIRP
jgi:glycosyltransferase involved in cell wall biosynthesis